MTREQYEEYAARLKPVSVEDVEEAGIFELDANAATTKCAHRLLPPKVNRQRDRAGGACSAAAGRCRDEPRRGTRMTRSQFLAFAADLYDLLCRPRAHHRQPARSPRRRGYG